MNNPSMPSVDDTGAQNPDKNVEDPGEFNQRLRLQEIGQARMSARTALGGEAQQAYGPDWQKVALREVQNFAREIEWLVRNRSAQEYFTKNLGTITIGPPTSEDHFPNVTVKRLISDMPSEKEITVRGLYTTQDTGMGFVDLPPSVAQSWTLNVLTKHEGPKDVTTTLERDIPITVVDEANSLCRKFINEVGLDARLEDKRPFTEY